VDKVVGYFSQAPYYQQHWQIWNEAHIDTGFWHDESIEQYIDTIHSPAANAIHSHYVDRNENGEEDPGERCIVVYGGWPCNHWTGGEYEQALGCWQTENGFGFSENPYWLPQLYIHDLYWVLNHNWHRPDQYREYFFHYYVAQPQMGFKWSAENYKYPNYYSMRTFMLTTWGDLYLPGEGRKIEPSQGIAADPLLCGGRLVFLFKDYEVGDQISVRLALRPGEQVASVVNVDVVWSTQTALPFQQRGDYVTIHVPTSEDDSHPKMCYISVSCREPMLPMNAE